MRRIRSVLLILGITLLGIYVAARADAMLFARREAAQLDERLSEVRGQARNTSAGDVRNTSAGTLARSEARQRRCWGRLAIPRVGLSVLLGEGTDKLTLLRVAGHVHGTSFPGESGNVAIAGHRDSVFRPLREVRSGDLIQLETPDGRFEYMVEDLQVVGPERVDVLAPTPDNVLTLVTCYPFTFIGPAPQRFIVRARATTPAS
jgi:sortase A